MTNVESCEDLSHVTNDTFLIETTFGGEKALEIEFAVFEDEVNVECLAIGDNGLEANYVAVFEFANELDFANGDDGEAVFEESLRRACVDSFDCDGFVCGTLASLKHLPICTASDVFNEFVAVIERRDFIHGSALI